MKEKYTQYLKARDLEYLQWDIKLKLISQVRHLKSIMKDLKSSTHIYGKCQKEYTNGYRVALQYEGVHNLAKYLIVINSILGKHCTSLKFRAVK